MRMNRPSFLLFWALLIGLIIIKPTDLHSQTQQTFIWKGYPVYSEKLPDGNLLHISDSLGFLIPLITDTEGTLIARTGNWGEYSVETPGITKTPEGAYLFNRDGEVFKYSLQGEKISSFLLDRVPAEFEIKSSFGIGNLLTGGFMTVVKNKDVISGGINILFLDLLGNVMSMIPIESNLPRYELKEAKIYNDSEAGFNVEFIFTSGMEDEYQIYKIDAFGNVKWSNKILTTDDYFLSLKNMYSYEKSDLSILNFSDRKDLKKGHFKTFNFDKVGNLLFEKSFPDIPEDNDQKIVGQAAQVIDDRDFLFIFESIENTQTDNSKLGIYTEKINESGRFLEQSFTKKRKIQNNQIAGQRPAVYKNDNGCYSIFAAENDDLIAFRPSISNCNFQSGSTDTIDLSLELEASTLTPEIWQNVELTLSVTNDGPGVAENIKIAMPLPSELAFSGMDLDSGDFDNIGGFWRIPELKPGTTAQVKLNLFTLSLSRISVFAQVINVDQIDSDSAPDNNISGRAAEDDEALVVFNSVDGLPDLYGKGISFIGDFLPDSTTTITYKLGNQGTDPAVGTYQIAAFLSKNSRIDDTDDLIGISTGENTPIGLLTGQMIDVQIPAGTAPGNYFVIINLDNSEDITESNEENNRFFRRIVVVESPDNLPDAPDLEVSIAASEGTYKIFEPLNFTVTISNKGGKVARDIIVALPFPDEFAFVESFASEGDFNFWLKHWNIDRMLPGTSQTMTITLFPIDNSQPQVLFAQVTQALPSDFDSTPGNADCCDAREDDEAAVTIIPFSSVADRSSDTKPLSKQKPLTIMSVFPNPTVGDITVKAYSNKEEINYRIVDARGTFVQKGKVTGTEFQDWKFEISELPAGYYGILFQTGSKIQKTDFLKIED